jgi:hypothetical protein
MGCCGDCRYGNVLSLYHPDKISCGLQEGAKIYHRDEGCELHKPKGWPRSSTSTTNLEETR